MTTIDITILDQTYPIQCNEQDKAALIKTQELIQQKLQYLQTHSSVSDSQKLTVLTLLTIGKEFIELQESMNDNSDTEATLSAITNQVQQMLNAD